MTRRKKSAINKVRSLVAEVKSQVVRSRNRRRRAPRARFQNRISGLGPKSRMLGRSLRDPWNISSCVPDGSMGVGCFTVKQVAQLSTGTGSSCAFFWFPSFNQSYTDSGSANASPTITGSYSLPVNSTAINALYGAYRPVSLGIRGTFIGNTVNDQGILLVGQVAADTPPSDFNGKNLTQCQALFQNYKLIPLRSGASTTWTPETMNDVDTWFNTGGGASGVTVGPDAPWLAMIVFAANASSSTLLVDAVINYEGQFASQTFMPGGLDVTENAAEPGWFEKAKNFVLGLDPIVPYVQSAVGTLMNPQFQSGMRMLTGVASRAGINSGYRPSLRYMDVD